MDLESDTLLVSGIVSFSDTLSFLIGWGRVGTDGSEMGEMGSADNRLLGGRWGRPNWTTPIILRAREGTRRTQASDCRPGLIVHLV